MLKLISQAVGVSEHNLYVFATPSRNSKNPLRGYQCLSNIIKCIAGIEKPELIKSTKLRKYVATVAQLKRNELEWLASHMGHDLSTHCQYYHLHESTLELVNVSNLLLAVDAGFGIESIRKSLDEITLKGWYEMRVTIQNSKL